MTNICEDARMFFLPKLYYADERKRMRDFQERLVVTGFQIIDTVANLWYHQTQQNIRGRVANKISHENIDL